MTDTPLLGLPLIEAAQAQKHVTHNEALTRLDALVMLAVLGRDLSTPPASPAEGDRYIVKAPGSGAFATKDDRIAHYVDGGWSFYAPRIGWTCYVEDEQTLVAWDGSSWKAGLDILASGSALQNLALLGLGTTADAANPFSAKLNNALWTARSLAEGGTGDLRCKLNKEAAANTLSLLFQTGYSGRAELGLAGDDKFHVKVSADGSAWTEALVLDPSSGRVGIGAASPGTQLTVRGANQTTAAFADGDIGGAINLYDTGQGAGNGGAVLFSMDNGGAKTFAAIKGLVASAGINGSGDIAFATRTLDGDAAMSEKMRIAYSGQVSIAAPIVSTSTTTGALTVTGGVGIGGALHVGGKLTSAASASGSAGFNIPAGAAPASPVDGDIWYDGANLKVRVGGTTKTIVLA